MPFQNFLKSIKSGKMLPNLQLLFDEFEHNVLRFKENNTQQRAFKTLKGSWIIAERKEIKFKELDDARIKSLFSTKFKTILGFVYSYNEETDKVFMSGIGWMKIDEAKRKREQFKRDLDGLSSYEPKTDKEILKGLLTDASSQKIKEVVKLLGV